MVCTRRTFLRLVQHTLCTAVAASIPVRVAGQTPHDHELILALDISSSIMTQHARINGVEKPHWKIQRDGHIDALRSAPVRDALLVSRPILRAVAWAVHARDLFPAIAIQGAEDIDRFTSLLRTLHPRTSESDNSGTKHHALLAYIVNGKPLARKRTLDISTDERVKSEVEICRFYRDMFASQGNRINGLAVADSAEEGAYASLRKNIITPNGFAIIARTWQHYSNAIQDKLILEVF